MPNDEIADIRRVRHQISEECGHDIHKVAEYYRQVEKELKASGQFRFEPSRESREEVAPTNAKDDK